MEPPPEEHTVAFGNEPWSGPGRARTFYVVECPPGEVGIGLVGRAGQFVDALGLICGPPPIEAPQMQVQSLPYGAVRYVRPTLLAPNGLRQWVDICREWGQNCGQPAADAFCQKQDPAKPDAVDFTPRPGAGVTATIFGGRICRGPECVGFEQITCANRATYQVSPDKPLVKPPSDKLKPR